MFGAISVKYKQGAWTQKYKRINAHVREVDKEKGHTLSYFVGHRRAGKEVNTKRTTIYLNEEDLKKIKEIKEIYNNEWYSSASISLIIRKAINCLHQIICNK